LDLLELEERIQNEIENLKDELYIDIKSEEYLDALFIQNAIHKLEWVLSVARG
jgi:protein-arginine kinase activator protein McsA